MTYHIIATVRPDWSTEQIQSFLLNRTPYPCGSWHPRKLYKALSGYVRAERNDRYLCLHCERAVSVDTLFCEKCHQIIETADL